MVLGGLWIGDLISGKSRLCSPLVTWLPELLLCSHEMGVLKATEVLFHLHVLDWLTFAKTWGSHGHRNKPVGTTKPTSQSAHDYIILHYIILYYMILFQNKLHSVLCTTMYYPPECLSGGDPPPLPRGGTPIWKGRGCSSGIFVLTSIIGTKKGVVQAVFDL